MTHAAYDQTPPVLHPIHVELFILTHSEKGEPLAHLPSLSIGLAGAILAELIFPVERVRIVDDAAVVVNRIMSGDPVADWAVSFLSSFRRSVPVREALRELAGDAYNNVTAGLIAGGIVERVTRRRLFSRIDTYPVTDPRLIYRVRGRLRYVALGNEAPDPQTDALAGFLRALSLESELYLDTGHNDLRGILAQMAARVDEGYAGVGTVIDNTENLIGDTAVSVYR